MTHNKNPLITTIVEEGIKKVQSGEAPFIDAEEIDLYLIGFIHGASAFALDSFTTAPGYRRLRREEEDAALTQLKEQLGIKPGFDGQVVDESEADKAKYGGTKRKYHIGLIQNYVAIFEDIETESLEKAIAKARERGIDEAATFNSLSCDGDLSFAEVYDEEKGDWIRIGYGDDED